MNLVAAGSPLTDMGFVWVFCSKYGGVSVTLSLSLTVPFPSFQVGKEKKSMGFWSIPWCMWDGVGTHGRSVVLGPSAHWIKCCDIKDWYPPPPPPPSLPWQNTLGWVYRGSKERFRVYRWILEEANEGWSRRNTLRVEMTKSLHYPQLPMQHLVNGTGFCGGITVWHLQDPPL